VKIVFAPAVNFAHVAGVESRFLDYGKKLLVGLHVARNPGN
jgi:hypothetical protein